MSSSKADILEGICTMKNGEKLMTPSNFTNDCVDSLCSGFIRSQSGYFPISVSIPKSMWL